MPPLRLTPGAERNEVIIRGLLQYLGYKSGQLEFICGLRNGPSLSGVAVKIRIRDFKIVQGSGIAGKILEPPSKALSTSNGDLGTTS